MLHCIKNFELQRQGLIKQSIFKYFDTNYFRNDVKSY